MQPKFKDSLSYEKAQLLMQPVFIRVIDNIRKETELSQFQTTYEEITEPYPSYLLCLQKPDNLVKFNVWELCFQVCFLNYDSNYNEDEFIEIDPNLLDETDEIDWHSLETKTQKLIKNIFNS